MHPSSEPEHSDSYLQTLESLFWGGGRECMAMPLLKSNVCRPTKKIILARVTIKKIKPK